MKRGVLIAFCIGFASIGFPQSISTLPVNFIDHTNGLEDTHNFFFCKDSKGFVWVSSWSGLHRYDGNTIRAYLPDEQDSTSIEGKYVWGEIIEDDQSNIWVSTYSALNCYIRSEDNFKTYHIDTTSDAPYYLITKDVDNKLWLMHGTDLYTFDLQTKRFNRKTTLRSGIDRAVAVLNDLGNVQYIITYSRELSQQAGFTLLKFDEGSFQYSKKFLDEGPHSDEVVKDIKIFDAHTMWVVCDKGLYHFNFSNFSTRKYWPRDVKEELQLRAVEQLSDTVLLVASYGEGLFTFHPQKEKFENQYVLISNKGVLNEVPQSLYKDTDGGIWISVGYRGIAYYHPGHIYFNHYPYDLSSPASNSRIGLNSLIEIEDGKVWGSSNKHGAVIFTKEPSIKRHYHSKSEPYTLSNNSTFSSYKDTKDRIWILTETTPSLRWPNGSIKSVKLDSSISIQSICELRNGKYIMGARTGGLYIASEVNKNEFELKKLNTVSTDKIYTYLFAFPDGRLLASWNKVGLDFINMNTGFEIIQTIKINTEIHCVQKIDYEHSWWLGTGRGIYSFQDEQSIPTYRKDIQCTPNMTVYGIIPQNDHTILFSTNKGIHRLNIRTHACQTFKEYNGTGTPIFNRFAYLKHSSGNVWFGNSFGITTLKPDEIRESIPPPRVNITALNINDQRASHLQCAETGTQNISDIKSIQLPYKQNTISFRFSAIDYKGIDRSKFEYRLQNFGQNWVQTESSGFARFGNLSPGNYTFEVRLADTPTDVRSMNIKIVPPLHQRWWFIVLLFLLTSFLVYWYFKQRALRKRKLKELEIEKKLAINTERLRIAHDVHDNLGSSISALGLRLKLIAEQASPGPIQNQLQQLSQTINKITQQVRETIWTINSDNDSIDNLITRLHKYAVEFFENASIEGSVRLPQAQRNDKIQGNHRREIFLAFKEALHNIQQHSKADIVKVEMKFIGKKVLWIRITDNGIGISPEELNKRKGTGMLSMKRRLQNCGGQFIFTSNLKGTQVTFIYPF